jgi:hypothetical protein
MSEPLMRLLAELPTAEPDAARAARTGRTCRAQLARQQTRPAGSTIPLTLVWRLFVSVLGAAYLIGAIIEAVRVYSFF